MRASPMRAGCPGTREPHFCAVMRHREPPISTQRRRTKVRSRYHTCYYAAAMRRRGSRGSSILEALGTIAFISIGVGGFAVNSVSLTRIDKTADSVTAATALAQQQLEVLRALPLGAAQLSPGVYSDPANPLRADGSGGGVFQRSWTVSGNDTPRAGLRTVTVRVSWTDSQPHSTRVAAYVRCSTIPCP